MGNRSSASKTLRSATGHVPLAACTFSDSRFAYQLVAWALGPSLELSARETVLRMLSARGANLQIMGNVQMATLDHTEPVRPEC